MAMHGTDLAGYMRNDEDSLITKINQAFHKVQIDGAKLRYPLTLNARWRYPGSTSDVEVAKMVCDKMPNVETVVSQLENQVIEKLGLAPGAGHIRCKLWQQGLAADSLVDFSRKIVATDETPGGGDIATLRFVNNQLIAFQGGQQAQLAALVAQVSAVNTRLVETVEKLATARATATTSSEINIWQVLGLAILGPVALNQAKRALGVPENAPLDAVLKAVQGVVTQQLSQHLEQAEAPLELEMPPPSEPLDPALEQKAEPSGLEGVLRHLNDPKNQAELLARIQADPELKAKLKLMGAAL